MRLLLTILSVVSLWSFLTLLVFGLLLIRKVLESVRGNMERITMGVRAIERQTAPLDMAVASFVGLLTNCEPAIDRLVAPLTAVEGALTTKR
jgi:hypothetical protein